MARADTRYRFVGSHVEYLSDGTALEPGTFHSFGSDVFDDEHNQDLVTRGVLIEAPLREPVAPAKESKTEAVAPPAPAGKEK